VTTADGTALQFTHPTAIPAQRELRLVWDGSTPNLVSRLSVNDVRINGLPFEGARPLRAGDVLRVGEQPFLVHIEGQRPVGSLEQAAWTHVESLQSGSLRIVKGARGALHVRLWAPTAYALEDLERAPLQFEIETLEVMFEARDEFRDAGRWWRRALGQLRGRTTFVVQRLLPWLPQPQRLYPPMKVTLDDVAVPLHRAAFIHAVDGRLVARDEWAPVPRLLRRGSAVELNFALGHGAVQGLQLEGVPLSLEPNERLCRALMPGDRWVLFSGSGTHHLRVFESTEAEEGTLPAVAPGRLTVGGVALNQFVRQSDDEVEQFQEVEPGRFVGEGADEFLVSPNGELVLRERPDEVPAPNEGRPSRTSGVYGTFGSALLLPAASHFLAGTLPLPSLALTPDVLRVFVDELHEKHDGAALAFQQFLDAETAEDRGHWFLKLIRSSQTRFSLRSWALKAFEHPASLPTQLHAADTSSAMGLLDAIADAEPMLSRVSRLVLSAEHRVFVDALLRIAKRPRSGLVIESTSQAGTVRLWPVPLHVLNSQWPEE
jgi:hypothetical protein